jgi:hypothetical protein
MAPRSSIVAWVTTISDTKILDAYSKYLDNPNVRIEDKLAYNYLESAVGKLFGGVARGGSEKLIPDISITDDSVLRMFKDILGIDTEQVDIETKFRRVRTAPSMAGEQPTISDLLSTFTETTTGVGGSKVSEAIKKTFKGSTITQAVQELNANNGTGWLELLKKKDTKLYQEFYNKAKFLQISYKLGTSVTALNLYTPKGGFKIPPFEMYYSKGTLYLSLNNAFEKKFLALLMDTKPLVIGSLDQLEKDFRAIKFGKTVKVSTRGANSVSVRVPTGGSIPLTKGKLNLTSLQKKQNTKQVNTPKPQKFISSAQWTFLVQKRLGDSMLSFGDPEPPDIKERTGRFRSSVAVTANYRAKTLQYTYNPLYRSLEHYGYHPELQVERSIRQVAQDLYAREFSIVRRGSLA